jgi:hypothetical protein
MGLVFQEMLAEQRAAGAAAQSRDIDIDDLLDDPELERLHAERLAAMQKEAEKRAALQRKGHGELQVFTDPPAYCLGGMFLLQSALT